MKSPNRLVLLFTTITVTLIAMVVALLLLNAKVRQAERLSMEIVELISTWNRIDNRTFDIVFSKYTLQNRDFPEAFTGWNRDIQQFGEDFRRLEDNRIVRSLPDEVSAKLDGAVRLWGTSEQLFSQARGQMEEIILTGLGERIMINGFLHTMYRSRMMNLLSEEEIFLIDDFLYSLETLDSFIREFDSLLRVLTDTMTQESRTYLTQLRQVVYATVLVTAGFFVSVLLIVVRFRRNEDLRRSMLLLEKEGLLKNLLSDSHNPLHLEEIEKNRQRLGVKLQFDVPLKLLLVEVSDITEFQVRHNLQEQDQILRELAGEIDRILADLSNPREILILDTSRILCIINDSTGSLEKSLEAGLVDTARSIRIKHNISIYTALSGSVTVPEELETLEKEACLLKDFHFLHPDRLLLLPDLLQEQNGDFIDFPERESRKLCEQLLSAHFSAASSLFEQLSADFVRYSPEIAKTYYLRLISDLRTSARKLESGYSFALSRNISQFMDTVKQKATLRDMKQEVLEMFDEAKELLAGSKDGKQDKTLLQVQKIIDTDFASPGLSPETVAQKLNLSASYINRLFRGQYGKSIAAYINEVRLDEAARILEETNDSVTLVGSEVGFSNNATFYRLFKNRFGVPPREYRTIKLTETK